MVPAPPIGIHITKGSFHVTLSRGFVDFILHNNIAQQFLEWTKLTKIPHETFYTSLNHSPHLQVPGSSEGNNSIPSIHPSIQSLTSQLIQQW